MIVTVDGPSGAGKSTAGRLLAERLGLKYVDTGALYRGVAWWIREKGLNVCDDADLQHACESIPLRVIWDGQGFMHVWCAGKDISEEIRSEEIGMLASQISAHRVVREAMWRVQRGLSRDGRMVFEGRDMGTQVFPDAEVRFFLTASLEERVSRRLKQIEGQCDRATFQAVKARMKQRDRQDSTRRIAPLAIPYGGRVIDTTGLSPKEVVDCMLEFVSSEDLKSKVTQTGCHFEEKKER